MTKKITAVVLSLVLAMSALFCGCSADDVRNALAIDTDTYDPATETVADVLGKTVSKEGLQSGAFTYLVFSDGTAAVTAWSGKDGVLQIPETLDGHTVIALENKALYKAEMTELLLPDSLEVVGNYAAMHCTNLEKVTFGKHIRNIGVSAFESEGDSTSSTGKGKLKTIVWNGAPEVIREKAFYYAHLLTEIVLPAGVREIGAWAFAKCYGADKIILGEGLEIIGDHAFLKCRAVKEISIPGTCKTVEVSAFYQCSAAETLNIGEGVETLKKGAFEECASLKTVTVPNSVQTMEDYIFYNCPSLTECRMGAPKELQKDIFTGDKNVTVIAPANSLAQTYAQENGIAFRAE